MSDFIIGAVRADPNGESNSGETYIVFGQSSGFGSTFNLSDIDGTNGFILNGIAQAEDSGHAVSSAGDINNDGYDDVIVGAPSADQPGADNTGTAYIVYGKSGGFDTSIDLSDIDGSNGFFVQGLAAGSALGAAVSTIGDINGDGIGDIIIGADDADTVNGANSGINYVIFGSSAGFGQEFELSDLDGTNGFVINGEDGGDHAGISVSNAGDINADGVDDLMVTAPTDDTDLEDEGRLYFYRGRKYADGGLNHDSQ
ncbi:MAG: hypothetical protein CMK07_16560, partial [Ponticaulis sp.]|nr:hypothetical protein [Ponticaulis sp.]